MASLNTRWVGQQLQSRLREDRHLLGAISQPHLPACLWTIVCDYTCEDPRVVDVMLSRVWVARDRDGDRTSNYKIDFRYGSNDYADDTNAIGYMLWIYQGKDAWRPYEIDNDAECMCGEWAVFPYLLMLPHFCQITKTWGGSRPLDDLDIKMRRALYSKIQ